MNRKENVAFILGEGLLLCPKEGKLVSFVRKWMHIETVVLKEGNQLPKLKCFICCHASKVENRRDGTKRWR